jgi:hypothetical protein
MLEHLCSCIGLITIEDILINNGLTVLKVIEKGTMNGRKKDQILVVCSDLSLP